MLQHELSTERVRMKHRSCGSCVFVISRGIRTCVHAWTRVQCMAGTPAGVPAGPAPPSQNTMQTTKPARLEAQDKSHVCSLMQT